MTRSSRFLRTGAYIIPARAPKTRQNRGRLAEMRDKPASGSHSRTAALGRAYYHGYDAPGPCSTGASHEHDPTGHRPGAAACVLPGDADRTGLVGARRSYGGAGPGSDRAPARSADAVVDIRHCRGCGGAAGSDPGVDPTAISSHRGHAHRRAAAIERPPRHGAVRRVAGGSSVCKASGGGRPTGRVERASERSVSDPVDPGVGFRAGGRGGGGGGGGVPDTGAIRSVRLAPRQGAAAGRRRRRRAGRAQHRGGSRSDP